MGHASAPEFLVLHALRLKGFAGTGAVAETVRFCSDYSAHPDGALSWRFRNDSAGSGVLGDLVSHGIDLGRYVVDDYVRARRGRR